MSSAIPAANRPDESSKSDAGATGDAQQAIFEQRMTHFMAGFRRLCEEADVPIACAIVCDPAVPEQPLVYARGHYYDVAKTLAFVLRRYRSRIAAELRTSANIEAEDL